MSNYRSFMFTFDAGPHRGSLEQDQIKALAEGFVRANEMAIAHNPGRYPRTIEDAGLRYIDPPTCAGVKGPCQPVLGAGPLVDTGDETCFGLACFHCALLRVNGDPRAYVDIIPRVGRYGPISGKWHAVVVTGSGVVLDTQAIVEKQQRSQRTG